jgi:subtilisin family serine protease
MMKRLERVALAAAFAAVLSACGGGSDPAGNVAADESGSVRASSASGSGEFSSTSDGLSGSSLGAVSIEFGPVSINRIDRRLQAATGPVEVWVKLSQAPAAARQAARLDANQSALSAGESQSALAAVDTEQRDTLPFLIGLGAEQMGRVRLAQNAVAIRIDAQRLASVSALSNVLSVEPVEHTSVSLAETVPYVGAAAAQAVGKDGRGVRVAVLDSGIDYTHAAFGGPGTTAAYVAAAGVNPASPTVPTTDPRAGTLDGLFPTAKVVGGFDYSGDAWPVGPRTEDPDPIDRWGHGSGVAHILAGIGGVAPGASLYAVKVCSSVGTGCNGIALLLGLDFALDPNGDGDIGDKVDVVNMSLGASYGQLENVLSEAASNVARAGVIVVAAAGNSGDRPYIVSSPSIAPEVISVAQTQVPSAISRFAALTLTPAPAGAANPNTAVGILDWALPTAAGTTGPMLYVGRGCPAGSGTPPLAVDDPYPAGADLAGKVVLIDRGICNASQKVDRAARAGAIGVVLADNVTATTPPLFIVGGGSVFVPTLTTTLAYGNAVKTLLASGAAVSANLRLTGSFPLAGSMVSTSARGPSLNAVKIKPEIGAPGASIAAVVGTGNLTARFGGTSGASPMVAGAAAILRQVYPTRSVTQIKALLMNSAETNILTNPVTGPELAPIARIGAGELRVDRALALEAAAWVPREKSAALSFGFQPVASTVTLEREVRVRNYSRSAKLFNISSSFRVAADGASGAVALSMPASIEVGPNGSEQFTVTMSIDASKLPAWTMTNGNVSGSAAALNGMEFDGYVTLKSATDTLSLPWHVLPRRAPTLVAAPRSLVAGNPLTIANGGITNGLADVFALTGVSPRADRDLLPQPGDGFAFVDIRAVGVRYAGEVAGLGPVVQFAVNTFGARSHPNYPAEFSILVDANRDGTPDYEIFNAENGGFAASGQNVAFVRNLATPTVPGRGFFFSIGGLNTSNVILTVPLSLLAPTAPATGPAVSLNAPFDFRVQASDNYFTGAVTDEIGTMTHTILTPRFATATPAVAVNAGAATSLATSQPTDGATASPSQTGLLLLYTAADPRREAEIVRMRDPRPPRKK